MVIHARFILPADGFRIGRAFTSFPNVEVTMDRVVPTGGAIVPFIWVSGADPAAVVRRVRAEGAVDRISILSEEGGSEALFRVVWNPGFRDAVVAVAESEMTLLSGEGTAAKWTFEFRAATNESLTEFQTFLGSIDVPSTLVKLTRDDGTPAPDLGDLTDRQRETLRLAYDRGYFEEPREVTLETLADEVGVSRQAVSGRLRRGLKTLLQERFAGSDPDVGASETAHSY